MNPYGEPSLSEEQLEIEGGIAAQAEFVEESCADFVELLQEFQRASMSRVGFREALLGRFLLPLTLFENCLQSKLKALH